MPRKGKGIYLRKDGRWEARYIVSRDENGKAKYAYIYGKSEQEVETKLIEKKAEIKAAQMDGIITFSEAAEEWLVDRRKCLIKATTDRYEYLMGRYIVPELGEEDVRSISPARINVFVAGLADKKKHGDNSVSGTTLENIRGIANGVVNFIVNRGKEYPALKALTVIEKKAFQILKPDEIRRVVSCAKYNKSTEMLAVLLALYAGIGTGELCALRWDDFDLKKREISISKTLYRLKDRSEESAKKTKLEVTNVRKSAVRTVVYPKELDGYVKSFYTQGTVFITCEKDRYMDSRTFLNHVDNLFSHFRLTGMKIQSLTKTYKEKLSDDIYLKEAFCPKTLNSVVNAKDAVRSYEVGIVNDSGDLSLNEKWLVKEMENDLASLRKLLGISESEMGLIIGYDEDEYSALEAGEVGLDWNDFMALLFVFKFNRKTEGVVDALGLYPVALRQRIVYGIERT